MNIHLDRGEATIAIVQIRVSYSAETGCANGFCLRAGSYKINE